MNPILIAGSIVVTLALSAYSIAIITEQIKKILTTRILIFITIGIILDIMATFLMILGSPNSPFTLHGFVGYSALAVMLIDTILIWRSYKQHGSRSPVPRSLHVYSRYAYIWWVLAYFTGGMLVVLK